MSHPAAEPGHVLVVDDDEDTCVLLGIFLRRRGYTATFAPGVSEARAALDRGEFSALITDLSLPDGSGLSLLANGRAPSLRAAVVMTGLGGDAGRREAERHGFDAYLVKPFDAAQLVSLLGELLAPGEKTTSLGAGGAARNLRIPQEEDEP